MSESEEIFPPWTAEEAALILELSATLGSALHGLGSGTQSAVLADLVSLWLAGHFDRSERDKPADQRPNTKALRDELFAEWTKLVLDLVPKSEEQVLAYVRAEGGT